MGMIQMPSRTYSIAELKAAQALLLLNNSVVTIDTPDIVYRNLDTVILSSDRDADRAPETGNPSVTEDNNSVTEDNNLDCPPCSGDVFMPS